MVTELENVRAWVRVRLKVEGGRPAVGSELPSTRRWTAGCGRWVCDGERAVSEAKLGGRQI